ncbi:TPA: histidine phosphatase family protein [Candidatus Gracilibacteria bacterium]|nr:hypothetical protein [Candidatus Peregrinibacteria bacterium]HIQ56587.1 histidine phosphatase family protein [Candidatus Gracilibacteria bacterium]HIQ57061.1 histidine phosphatase family protein [Candidatus Gracilibacteria bacterium]
MFGRNKIIIARHGITEWNKAKRMQGQTNNIALSSDIENNSRSIYKYT